jgi:hypothetical protein
MSGAAGTVLAVGKLADTLELLKLGAQVSAARGAAAGVSASSVGVLTPWSEQVGLAQIVADEIGYAANGVTRAEALSVPAIAKGRAILHALIVQRPLVALDRNGRVDPQPTWLYRSDTGISPQYRLACILDDLIFSDSSGLLVNRSTVDRTRILDAVHVPRSRWSVDAAGRVLIDGQLVDEADAFVLIPGPGPGLLNQAADHIRAAKDLDRAWQARARNPFPAMELHEVEDNGMTQDEASDYVEAVAKARRNPDAAVMFTPHNIDLRSHAAEVTDFYDGGRNALRLDFANFLNLPAALLEGSLSTASLTYSTQEGKRNEVFDYSVGYWIAPIQDALSGDNVCPRGQRIRFDFADLESTTATPTGAAMED